MRLLYQPPSSSTFKWRDNGVFWKNYLFSTFKHSSGWEKYPRTSICKKNEKKWTFILLNKAILSKAILKQPLTFHTLSTTKLVINFVILTQECFRSIVNVRKAIMLWKFIQIKPKLWFQKQIPKTFSNSTISRKFIC